MSNPTKLPQPIRTFSKLIGKTIKSTLESGEYLYIIFIDGSYCIVQIDTDVNGFDYPRQVLNLKDGVNDWETDELYQAGIINEATHKAESARIKMEDALREAAIVAKMKQDSDNAEYAEYQRLKYKFDGR